MDRTDQTDGTDVWNCPQCGKQLTNVGAFWVCPQHGQVSIQERVAPFRILLRYRHENNEARIGRTKADLEKRGHNVSIDKNETKPDDDCLIAKFGTHGGADRLERLDLYMRVPAPAESEPRKDLLKLADVVDDCLNVFLGSDMPVSETVAKLFEKLVTVALDCQIPLDRRHALAVTLNRAAYRTAPGRILRILVVEDSLMNQKLMSALLRKRGHNVELANNGREGVEAVEANSYDVILMNIQMPEMDGEEATKAIRALPDLQKAQLPIIAVTAFCMKKDIRRFLQGGMNDYLPHPVRPAVFASVVEALAIWHAARTRGEIFAVMKHLVHNEP